MARSRWWHGPAKVAWIAWDLARSAVTEGIPWLLRRRRKGEDE